MRFRILTATVVALLMATVGAAQGLTTGRDPQGDGTRAVDIRAVEFTRRFATSPTDIWTVVAIRSHEALQPERITWVRWQLDTRGGGAAEYQVTATYEAGDWSCQLDSLRTARSVAGVSFRNVQRVGCRLPFDEVRKSKPIRFRAAAEGRDTDPDSLWVDLAPDSGWYDA